MNNEELRNILKDRGIKQTWVAKKLGISRGLVNQWVNDRTDILPHHQIELKNILKQYVS